MVIINETRVTAEMHQTGLDKTKLAAAMDVDQRTVENMLTGKALSHKTQVGLYQAFEGRVPFDELFIVTPGESLSAPAGEPPPVRQSGAVGVSVPHEREAKEEVA